MIGRTVSHVLSGVVAPQLKRSKNVWHKDEVDITSAAHIADDVPGMCIVCLITLERSDEELCQNSLPSLTVHAI
eukprot:5246322-Amphidinium_carterae.1